MSVRPEGTGLERVLLRHGALYPKMEPQDGVKLVFQHQFGGGHLISDEAAALERLRGEYGAVEKGGPGPLFEDIGNGLVRVTLAALDSRRYPLEALCRDFIRSAERHTGSREGFLEHLETLKALARKGAFGFSPQALEGYLEGYLPAGCPPVSHSETYRRAYAPAYRVVRRDCLSHAPAGEGLGILREVLGGRLAQGGRTVVAIDGRCAAGKTTLAAALAAEHGGAVIHMDDFFLRPEQRTAARYQEPGGNVDRERFLEEVLLPLRRGERVVYRPFDCGTQRLAPPKEVEDSPLVVVEGSYSCHPELAAHYDLRVFLTVGPEEQMARIVAREGEGYARTFREKWIPLEERYFSHLHPERRCELCLW